VLQGIVLKLKLHMCVLHHLPLSLLYIICNNYFLAL